MITLYRKAHFNAAHRLYRKDWSDQKNKEVFGKCSNPNYHGHNYELMVGVTGKINPETGYVIDISQLKEIIKQEVEIPFDHKNLNLEVEAFQDTNPTVENIAVEIWNRIQGRLDNSKYQITITLYETPRNFVVYNGKDQK